MNKRIIPYAALVCFIAIGVVVFWMNASKEQTPAVSAKLFEPSTSAPNRPRDASDTPTENNDDVGIPRDDSERRPSDPREVERLFQALATAAELKDRFAANEARRRLALIGGDEVHDRAIELLSGSRDATNDTRAHLPPIMRSSCLYLVALSAPETALSWLVERWSEPRLTQDGRKTKWTTYDLRPVEHYADSVLEHDDVQEAAPIGRMLSWISREDEIPPRKLITHLEERYGAAISGRELPDPWLSRVFRSLMVSGIDIHDSSAAEVKHLIAVLRDNDRLSARLRSQLAEYLVGESRSIYELLDIISEAPSVAVAAKALHEYLQAHSLSEHEIELLVAAIHQNFGSVPDGPASMLNYISASGAAGIPIDNLQTLVGTLLSTLAEGERTPAENLTMIEMIEGLRRSWTAVSNRSGVSNAIVPMFDITSRPEAKNDLLKTFRTITVPGDTTQQELARSRVMGLIWDSPLAVAEKLDTSINILKECDAIDYMIAWAIIYGLKRSQSQLDASHGAMLAECLDFIFYKWKGGLREDRPYQGSGSPLSLVASVAIALKQCDYPRIPKRLWDKLGPVVEGLIDDSSSWPGPEGRKRWFDYRTYLDRVKDVHIAYSQ